MMPIPVLASLVDRYVTIVSQLLLHVDHCLLIILQQYKLAHFVNSTVIFVLRTDQDQVVLKIQLMLQYVHIVTTLLLMVCVQLYQIVLVISA